MPPPLHTRLPFGFPCLLPGLDAGWPCSPGSACPQRGSSVSPRLWAWQGGEESRPRVRDGVFNSSQLHPWSLDFLICQVGATRGPVRAGLAFSGSSSVACPAPVPGNRVIPSILSQCHHTQTGSLPRGHPTGFQNLKEPRTTSQVRLTGSALASWEECPDPRLLLSTRSRASSRASAGRSSLLQAEGTGPSPSAPLAMESCHPHLWTPPPPPGTPICSTTCQNSPRPSGPHQVLPPP